MKKMKSGIGRLLWTIGGVGALVFVTSVRASELTIKSRIKIRKKSYVVQNHFEDSEDYTLEKLEVLQKKRRNLILDIKKFLREATSEDQKAELNLRLGSLYIEDYHSSLSKAQQIYEQQVKEFESKKSQGKPPKLDNSEAMSSLDKSRNIYRDLLHRVPNHRDRDQILYFLGACSLDKGLVNEGMAYFKQLATLHPKSKYATDAQVQLADHYFDSNKFREAEANYDRILALKNHPLVAYAAYKKAWCAYNTGRIKQALDLLKWVVIKEEHTNPGAPMRIRQEALRDITLPFVDLKLLSESIEFFRPQGEPHFRRGLETMASIYLESADYPRAITLWETLISLDRNHPKNPLYDISIVDAHILKHQPQAALTRLFERLPNYSETSSWYELNASQPKAIAESFTKFEETARKLAYQFHAEAQKTKNKPLYDLAGQAYAQYLEVYPNTHHSQQIRFYLAEILYKNSDYKMAAQKYHQVYRESKDSSLKLDAIRYALSALDRQLNADRKKQGLGEISSKTSAKLKGTDSGEFVPFSEVEAQFIEIATDYLKIYSDQKDAPDVLFEVAYLQYLHRDFLKAYKNFWYFNTKYVFHPSAYTSAHLILDILNRKSDYPKLVGACQRFLETRSFSRPDFRTDVARILRQAELKRITLLEEKGLYKDAADQYIVYTKNYGAQDESLFEKALYNASVNYSKAELHLLATDTQEKFLRRFPTSTYKENLLLQVAKSYEMMANFEKAAHYYEHFSVQFPKNTQTKNAMRLSGLYHWGTGQTKRAERIMLSFIKEFENDKERELVQKDLLELYESQGDIKAQQLFYRKMDDKYKLSSVASISNLVRTAEIEFERTGKVPWTLMDDAVKKVQQAYREIVRSGNRDNAIPKVLLWILKRKEDDFSQITLSRVKGDISALLQKKIAILKELEKEYLNVATVGKGEWVLASFYKTATLYQRLAEEISLAPVPNELSAEQIEMYRSEIQKTMIKPFQEKAISFAVQCLEKSQEFNLNSQWNPQCYSLASMMDPKRYPKIRTLYLPPALTVMLEPQKGSKIKVGSKDIQPLPYYSSGIFMNADRMPAFTKTSLFNATKRMNTDVSAFTYQALVDERKAVLNRTLQEEKPDEPESVTFSYLNALRCLYPEKAIPLILEAISRDPKDASLHNLLALAYLEEGNLPAAKITYLALQARGIKDPGILNNLGVLAYRQNNERQAIEFFEEAILGEAPKEALANLGYIALSYRNGFEAKKTFEKAALLDKNDLTIQLGLAISQIQNGETTQGRQSLIRLAKAYRKDPYVRLSLGYFLIDAEKEVELAKQLLSEYMEEQSAENDLYFRQAMREVKPLQGELPAVMQ